MTRTRAGKLKIGRIRRLPCQRSGSVKQPLGVLRVKADKAFSDYIRQRDGGKCCTCCTRIHWKLGDCGHWIPKGNHNWGVRYDERNAHFQCKPDNQGRNVISAYHSFMGIRYGLDVMQNLQQQKHWTLIEFVNRELLAFSNDRDVHTTREAFEFIIKYYTEKTKGLENGKGQSSADLAQRSRKTEATDEA